MRLLHGFSGLQTSTAVLFASSMSTQLVQDAVALMNPSSANQTRVKLRLEPLPRIWCRPHALNVAVASVLNTMLGSMLPVTIDTCLREGKVIVRIARCSTGAGLNGELELHFAVVEDAFG